MNTSRGILRSKRFYLTGLVAVLLGWLCCDLDLGGEPQRVAVAMGGSSDVASNVHALDGRDRSETLQTAVSGMHSSPQAGGARTSGEAGSQAPANGGATGLSKGTTAAVCGAIPSSYEEHSRFVALSLPRRWGLNTGASQPGATLISTKRGPASNPGLCARGCAVLSFTIPAGSGWGGGAIVDEWFATPTNLYGATVRAQVALELARPSLPVNVRIYTQGDIASNYSWGTTASLATATLADVSSFHEIVLHPVDRRGNNPFCASATGAIGIQVQRSRTTTSGIPVKLYIKSVTIGDEVANDEVALGLGGQRGQGDNRGRRQTLRPEFGGEEGYCRLAESGSLQVAADDWVTAGTCQGYGFTYTLGERTDTKVVPACSASRCTPRLSKISSRGLCASGTIAADPTWKSKVGLGFDLDPTKKNTTGLALTYQMSGTAILRFLLDDGEGSLFCADLEETEDDPTTVNLPWESLTTRCWDRWEPGAPYDPSWPIKGIQLSASCLASKSAWFDMCITGLATY